MQVKIEESPNRGLHGFLEKESACEEAAVTKAPALQTAPLVSLCCSTYSRPDLFAHSLAGLLRQTYANLEIVILVDGGNPESLAILAQCNDPRLRWFSTDVPSGMIPAWNKVVSASNGKYFLYCADDDMLLEKAIDRQIAMLEEQPGVGFCHADFFLVDDEGNRIGRWKSHEGTWIKPGLTEFIRYLCQPKACMQTCVVRRRLWDQVGGWDEDAGYPGDNSLYLKLLRVCDVGHVSHDACEYRVRTRNPDSWEKDAGKVREDVALARKHLVNLPEPLLAQAFSLDRAVRNHFARNAISVLADTRATSEQKARFAEWVASDLLGSGAGGGFYRWVLRWGLEPMVARGNRVLTNFRGIGRSVAGNVLRPLRVWRKSLR